MLEVEALSFGAGTGTVYSVVVVLMSKELRTGFEEFEMMMTMSAVRFCLVSDSMEEAWVTGRGMLGEEGDAI